MPEFNHDPLLMVRPNPGTIVDIGANIGYQLKLFMIVPDAHVVAYEPQHHLFARLYNELCTEFGSVEWPANIELHNVALSNFCGRSELRIPVLNNTSLAHEGASLVKDFAVTETTNGTQVRLIRQAVQVMTLDSQNLQNVTYIKIDAEGAEEEILRGGEQLLRSQKPVLDLELEEVHRASCLKDVPEFLAALGYQGYFILEDNLYKFEDFNAAQHQRCDDSGIGATNYIHPYVYDFLFVHQTDAWALDRLTELFPNRSHMAKAA